MLPSFEKGRSAANERLGGVGGGFNGGWSNVTLLLVAFGFGYAQPAVSVAADEAGWTAAPVLLPAPAKGADRRAQFLVQPVNLTSQQVVVFPPFGGETPLASWTAEPQEAGKFAIKSHGKGNYHWITASSEDGKRLASSVYYFSNPGAAPRELLQQDMSALEIKPLQLPREHSQFRANETWAFQVLYQGKPMPYATVQLETSNGTRRSQPSNGQGQFGVTFPDDFKALEAGQHEHHAGGHGGGHGMDSAQFALSVEYVGDHQRVQLQICA